MLDLKHTLQVQGVTIAELARKSEIPIRTIEDIIVRGDCKYSTAEKIAQSLGIDVGELRVKNYVFASHESDFEKASRLQPPYRTPCIASDNPHYAGAAEELEERYKVKYPNLYDGSTLIIFCVDEKGEHTRFTYSYDYREFDEDAPDLP